MAEKPDITSKATPNVVLMNDISPDGIPTGTTAKTSIREQQQVIPEPVKEEKVVDAKSEKKIDDKTKEEPEIDINDFLDITGKKHIKTEKKAEDKKVDEKIDPKPDDKIVELDPNTRQFEGIEEHLVPHFKKMSNDAFNTLKPILQEFKKLKQEVPAKDAQITKLQAEFEALQKNGPQIPETYTEHPDAYLLTPEFKQGLGQIQDAQLILNHWTKQLAEVEGGATEIDVLGLNKETGEYYVSHRAKVDKTTENTLIRYQMHAQQALDNSRAQVATVQATHQAKHQESNKQLEILDSSYFGVFDKTENKAVYEPIIKDTFEKLPMSIPPKTRMFMAKSLTMIVSLSNILKKAAEEKAKTAPVGDVKVTKREVQPGAAEAAGDGGGAKTNGANKEEVSFDDFNKVKRGY